MKSQIFKTAWQLVKEMGINFSLALKISWSEFKINAMCIIYNTGGCNDWHLMKKIDGLKNQLGQVKPCNIEYKYSSRVVNNDGAAAWYGIGVYNGD